MQIERLEKIFLVIAVAVMVAAIGAIGASVFAAEIHLPSPSGRVDPRQVRQTPPFDQPGLREIAPGSYEAVIIAQIWSFQLALDGRTELRIPAGSTVTFKITSTDVIHSFMIERTNVNVMVIPGEITEVSYTFDKPGEYLMICNEYCGIGHHMMFAKVVVE